MSEAPDLPRSMPLSTPPTSGGRSGGIAALARLGEVLAGPLPGHAAQARYEPELAFGRHGGPAPRSARAAAVAVLLYERDGVCHVPLTVRPAHLANHAGQISLPGGLVEPDESTADAAVRELEEELGVEASSVTLLGSLSPLYLYVTDFLITPHVAVVDSPPTFRPSDAEVAEVIEMPLHTLLDDQSPRREKHGFRGLEFYAPALCVSGHEVWGATAMILAELAAAVVAAQHASPAEQ
ncbi:MAG: CoA pyrophosphatase [Pirellulales bacterium]